MSDAKSEDAGAGFAAWVEGLNAEAARLGLNPAYWPMTREQVESHPTPFRYSFALGLTPAETLEGYCFEDPDPEPMFLVSAKHADLP